MTSSPENLQEAASRLVDDQEYMIIDAPDEVEEPDSEEDEDAKG